MDRAWGAGAPASARAVGRARLLQTPPDVTYGDYVACAAFDVTPRLGDIRAPALVIGAPGDQLTPFRLSAALAARLPDAELVAISDAGHMLTLEQPEAIAAHVARFLSRLSA
ncbi:MAG: alpha/beta hydrolase [Anaerolineae bacterium]|nr:alpha/beta hydrolase [Anaerolineae bacterium]